MMADLPPELLRSLSAQLSPTDVLAARSTCSQWAHALSPLFTQLRIPLVPAPCTACSGEAAAVIQPPAEQLAAALERLPSVSSITLLLTADTTALDLQQALRIIGSKSSITKLVLDEVPDTAQQGTKRRSYAPELQLGGLVHVADLTIRTLSWTLEDIWRQAGALHMSCDSAGASGADTSCSSSSSSGGGGGSSSSSYAQLSAPCNTSPLSRTSCALRRLTIKHPRPSDSVLCSTFSGSCVSGQMCRLQGLTLPSQLTHLCTPLPGQYTRDGEVGCALNAAHEEYARQLAAGLPGLLSLTLTGLYEGREEAFKGFARLRELHCRLGDSFRSIVFGMHHVIEESPAMLLPGRLGALQRVDLLPLKPPQQQRQQQEEEAFELHIWRDLHRRPLLPPLLKPFKLHMLQHMTQLQHLATPLTQSGEDLTAVRGQLRSLTGQYLLPSEELLREVFAVGSQLSSLALFETVPHFTPRATQRELHNLLLHSSHQLLPSPSAALTNLLRLTLMGSRRSVYTAPDPASVWARLPALQSLALQNVALGYSPSGALRADRAVAVPAQSAAAALPARVTPGERLLLWLSDLPCRQLTRLELSQYAIVVGPPAGRQHVPAAAAAVARNVGSGSRQQPQPQPQQQQGRQGVHGGTFDAGSKLAGLAQLSLQAGALPPPEQTIGCSSCDLSGLQHLTLVDCCCLALLPDPPGVGSSSADNSQPQPQPAPAVAVGIALLLSQLVRPAAGGGGSSSLLRLRVQAVRLRLSDLQYICCSPLGKQLQELYVDTQASHGDSTASDGQQQQQQPQRAEEAASSSSSTGSQHGPGPQCLEDVLAAATTAGNLQQLRNLSLAAMQLQGRVEPALGGVGLSMLTACAGLRSLQRLHLHLDADAGSEPGWCGCSGQAADSSCMTATVKLPGKVPAVAASGEVVPAFEGPVCDLLKLQHLRVLEAKLVCHEQRPTAGLGPDTGSGHRECVVGCCSKCGGAVSESSVRAWLRLVAAFKLPGCRLGVQVLPAAY